MSQINNTVNKIKNVNPEMYVHYSLSIKILKQLYYNAVLKQNKCVITSLFSNIYLVQYQIILISIYSNLLFVEIHQ